MAKALIPRNGYGRAMTGCRIAGLTLSAPLHGIVLSQAPDIIRYIRISNM